MVRWIVIDHNAKLRKGVCDVVIKLYGVIDRGLIIKRHAKQQTIGAGFLSESRLAHRLSGIQICATDHDGHAFFHRRHRCLDQFLMLFPQQRVEFSEAAGAVMTLAPPSRMILSTARVNSPVSTVSSASGRSPSFVVNAGIIAIIPFKSLAVIMFFSFGRISPDSPTGMNGSQADLTFESCSG